MFKIKQQETYPFPVDVKVPNSRIPGQFETHRFTAIFKVLPLKDREQLIKQASIDGFDLELVRAVLVDWSDIADPDGNVLTFNADTLNLVMDDPRVLSATVEAYRKSLNGEAVQARRAGN